MSLSRAKINTIFVSINDTNNPRKESIQAKLALLNKPLLPLPTDRPPINYSQNEAALLVLHIANDDLYRDIASILNDKSNVLVTTPVRVADVEKWFHVNGVWLALQVDASDEATQLKAMFTSSMSNESVSMAFGFMVAIIDRLTGLDIQQKDALKALGDSSISIAASLQLPRLYMRDVKEALR